MNTVLIRERYKVVRVLYSEPDYALVEAVDIQERETPTRQINLYEGELLHRYGRLCAGIDPADCPAFQGMFLCGDTLAAVFEDCGGVPIDQVFYKGDRWPLADRLAFAELVLHRALEMANLPPEISCAAMLSENLFVDAEERRVRLRYMLRPLPDMTARELPLLAGDQVKKILPRRWDALEAELAFLDELDAGCFRAIVPLYARWRAARADIQAQQEEFESKNILSRAIALIKLRLKRWKKRRARR